MRQTGYAFNFQGHGVFTPDGRADGITDVDAHNKQLEAQEIERLKTAPEKVFLYVKVLEHGRADIHTWNGTVVGNAELGPKRQFRCFGPFPSIRRSVTVCLFGKWYHGWYFESSGDYCRLKRAV